MLDGILEQLERHTLHGVCEAEIWVSTSMQYGVVVNHPLATAPLAPRCDGGGAVRHADARGIGEWTRASVTLCPPGVAHDRGSGGYNGYQTAGAEGVGAGGTSGSRESSWNGVPPIT
jgi:hypothetical protein